MPDFPHSYQDQHERLCLLQEQRDRREARRKFLPIDRTPLDEGPTDAALALLEMPARIERAQARLDSLEAGTDAHGLARHELEQERDTLAELESIVREEEQEEQEDKE